jgi:transcriptional regulator with XRE-family HTH domain
MPERAPTILTETVTATLVVHLDAAACQALGESRRRRGFSQKWIAIEMGITQSQLSAFERGKRLPTPELGYRWVVALGLRRRVLLVDDEEAQHAFGKSLQRHR